MRAKITISYDGSRYHGFQVQNSGVATVANSLEDAFKTLGIASKFEASGRTDRGVHALNQVLSISLPDYWRDLDELKRRLNFILPGSIVMKRIEEVEEAFHARFSAKSRVYRYIAKCGDREPFGDSYVTYLSTKIDEKMIGEAIKLFEGEHDFRGFMKEGSGVKDSKRVMKKTLFYEHKGFHIFYFEADGFLRSQIRMMVAFLLKISSGELSVKELKLQLENRGRFCRELAPPNGLYLTRIKY